MKRKNNARNKKGFSVAELIIAFTILIIVTSMVAIIFRSTQRSFLNAKAFQHVIDLARQTVMRMHSTLQATYVESTGIINFVGIDASGTHIKANSQEDEVFFVLPHSINETTGDINEVGYWQRDDGHIMRHLDSSPDFDFATATSDDELGLVISALNFQYYDGTTYHDSWDSRVGGTNEGEFPQAIKFSFNVSDEEDVVKKKFESLVRIASTGR
jgi:type II secretory pathway pseudopilin PulG